ncbi:MAG TPA: hypothetical protein VHP63_06120, partial [candidate division Zixibacteria bacterium]|nr:hypothetical protein [candidate division Zixibacteria bacterium]
MPSHNRLSVAVVSSILFIAFISPAYSSSLEDNNRKKMSAVKFNSHDLKFDGQLDDSIWKNAVFVSDFLQKEPTEGGQPVDSTKIAIVYDEDALYVGARMYCKNPQALRMHLDKHDVQGPAEQLIVCLDTYLDRRTAYVFGVNTAGVRFDRFHYE